jgi:hypothetical protein
MRRLSPEASDRTRGGLGVVVETRHLGNVVARRLALGEDLSATG